MSAHTNLQASHPGNTNALRHGVYSRRALAARGEEIADVLMGAPHTVPLDTIAAQEIGALIAMLERIDMALAERGVTGNKTLLDLRLRASGRLQRWLDGFGATPASRAAHSRRAVSPRGKSGLGQDSPLGSASQGWLAGASLRPNG